MKDIVVRTEGLSKDYIIGPQPIHALAGISVTVRRGEFVAVVGPSGSGKSTFMNLLGCLDTPTAGRYVFDGEDLSSVPKDALARIRSARIGFVFQTFNLLPRMTALENVALPLLYGGVPRRLRRGRAEEVLASVGLADRAHHQPTQLSGGEQQRVAIARALVNEPAMILADEPTGAVDSRTGVEIMAQFQRLNRDGITIILVTHEADIAGYARRKLRFHDGRLAGDEAVAAPSDAAARLAALTQGEELKVA
ncbi:MAG: ABC transporter ATP-binding protein [Alphaproteobacteria bacterium]